MVTDRQITLTHTLRRLSAMPPSAPPSYLRTDRLHLLILHQDLMPHPLAPPPTCLRTDRLHLLILHQDSLQHPHLLPPPVYGRTDYTFSYFIKTHCHTPFCYSPLFTDRQITLAHNSSRLDATPPCSSSLLFTDYTCSFFIKTHCNTPFCSLLLFMDRQITISHTSSRLTATPPSASPLCLRTDRQITLAHT